MPGGAEERRLAQVREYVADVVGCRPEHVVTVHRFEDGNRHHVYGATYLDAAGVAADLVVRVSLGDDDAEREQAEREAMVLELLAGVGAPRLIDLRLTNPWFAAPVLSMQLVRGRSIELRSVASADIERLGSVVASVHAQPVDDLTRCLAPTGSILSYADGRLQHILHGLPWARAPLPASQRDRLRHAADVIQRDWTARRDTESFRSDEKPALLHGDIAFGNVLWGPDPVLIDWEYARLGDPADEIAYLIDQNVLDAEPRDAFWRGYRAPVSRAGSLADIMERTTWWAPLTLLGSTLWWVERFVRSTDAQHEGGHDPALPKAPGYYLEHALTRLDRLEHLLDPA